MFRALLMRDGGCAHPGCRSRRGVQAHHIEHWINGGRTDLANLVLLCERHHHAHHDGEFEIAVEGSGRLRFVRRDGRILDDVVDRSRIAETVQPIDVACAEVHPDAATPLWNGDRMDRHWAVAVLAQRRERARAG